MDGLGGYTGEITAVGNGPSSGSAVEPPGLRSGTYPVTSDRTFDLGASQGFIALDDSLIAWAVSEATAYEETGIGLMLAQGSGLNVSILSGRYNMVLWGSDHGSEFTSGIGYVDFDGAGGFTGVVTEVAQGQATGSAFDAGNATGAYTVASNGLVTLTTDGSVVDTGYVSADGSLLVWAPVPGDPPYEETGINVAVKQGAGFSNSSLCGTYNWVGFGSDHGDDFTSGIGHAVFDGARHCSHVSTAQAQGQAGDSAWEDVGEWSTGVYEVGSDGRITIGNTTGFVSADRSLIVLAPVPGDSPYQETGITVLMKAPASAETFAADSADFSSVPFVMAKAGDTRTYEGFGDKAGTQRTFSFTQEQLLGVNCLRWNWIEAPLEASVWMANDTLGTPWLFKFADEGTTVFAPTSLDEVTRLVDAGEDDLKVLAHLMTGDYAEGMQVVSDPASEGHSELINTHARIAPFAAREFVLLKVTDSTPGGDDVDWVYYHPLIGRAFEVWDDSGSDIYKEGFIVTGWDQRMDVLAGDWAIETIYASGTLQFDGSGGISGGSVTDTEGTTFAFTGGQCLVNSSGWVTMTVTTDPVGPGPLIGAVNATRDVAVLSPSDRPMDPDDDGDLIVLVKHTGTFSNADLKGAWSVSLRQDVTGTVVFNGLGGITSGSFRDGEGGRGTLTGGSYTVNADGAVSMTLNVRAPDGPLSLTLTGAMNDSKDVTVLNEHAPADPDNPSFVVLTRNVGGFGAADLAGSWTLVVDQTYGSLTVNGRGRVTSGNYTDADGNTFHLTGKYSVANNGRVTITLASDEPDSHPIQLVGALNAGKNVLPLTMTNVDWDKDDPDLVILVNSSPVDLCGAFGTIKLPGTAVPGDKGPVPVIVTNEGQIRATGKISIKLYMSSDQFLDGDDVFIGQLTNQVIDLGFRKAKTFTVPAAIPAGTEPGKYHLLAHIDADNAIPEGNEDNNVFEPDGLGEVVWQFGNVGERKNVPLKLTDFDGTLLTFGLSGNGTGQVQHESGGWRVSFANTDARSSGMIATSKSKVAGDDGEVKITGIGVHGSMQSFFARTGDLIGDFDVAGSIRQITMDDADGDGLTLSVGPEDVVNGLRGLMMTFDQLGRFSVDSETQIQSLRAANWASGKLEAPLLKDLSVKGEIGNVSVIVDDVIGSVRAVRWSAGTIQADSMTTMNVSGAKASRTTPAISGDLGAGLTLYGNLVPKGKATLNSGAIAGSLAANASITGDVRSMQIGLLEADLTIDGNISALKVGQPLALMPPEGGDEHKLYVSGKATVNAGGETIKFKDDTLYAARADLYSMEDLREYNALSHWWEYECMTRISGESYRSNWRVSVDSSTQVIEGHECTMVTTHDNGESDMTISMAWYSDDTGTHLVMWEAGSLNIDVRLAISPEFLRIGKKYIASGAFSGEIHGDIYGSQVDGTVYGTATGSSQLVGHEQVTVPADTYLAAKVVWALSMKGKMDLNIDGEPVSASFSASESMTMWCVPDLGVVKAMTTLTISASAPGYGSDSLKATVDMLLSDWGTN
jgi:hypothetical protein